jgi:hypothetical protein
MVAGSPPAALPALTKLATRGALVLDDLVALGGRAQMLG